MVSYKGYISTYLTFYKFAIQLNLTKAILIYFDIHCCKAQLLINQLCWIPSYPWIILIQYIKTDNRAQKSSETLLYYITLYTSMCAFKHQCISVPLSAAVIAQLCSNIILHLVMFSNKGHNKQRLLKAFMVNDYCIM